MISTLQKRIIISIREILTRAFLMAQNGKRTLTTPLVVVISLIAHFREVGNYLQKHFHLIEWLGKNYEFYLICKF